MINIYEDLTIGPDYHNVHCHTKFLFRSSNVYLFDVAKHTNDISCNISSLTKNVGFFTILDKSLFIFSFNIDINRLV
jgi:hypothetical protein